MALQAWFQLDKDINNSGLIESAPTNNGAALETG